MRNLLSSGLKFLLAGRGLSFRTGKYFGQAVLVGILAGLVVVAFRHLITLGYDWIFCGVGGAARWVFLVLSLIHI